MAPFSLHWDQDVGRGTLSFGAKSYVQTLAAHLHYRIDLYLIALLLNPEQVAFYSIAVNMTNPILQIPDAIGTVIFPKLAGSSDQARARANGRHLPAHALRDPHRGGGLRRDRQPGDGALLRQPLRAGDSADVHDAAAASS